MNWVAIVLILGAAAWRMLAVQAPELGNFTPLMALAFCGGAYFRDRRMWLVPFAALGLSDLYLNHYYAVEFHYSWTFSGALVRLFCFSCGLALGWVVAARRSWLALFAGAITSSMIFFLVTNTASWAGDQGYPHDGSGWWQAMTIGHPQFAPTLFFFRNTFVSDLLFTACFALSMEALARRRGEKSLLGAVAAKK